ncbi:MAG: site-specific DNA-methyltransferase [Bacteroidaceae bacterium]|nr:site-specific DNA-methyltransferase [Bacteroidaceae bacterium]MBS7323206.1 site-specific DNA-methyltransferase [Bacteroidaceae bacterium]
MTAKNNRTLRIGGEERESLMQMIDGQSLIHGDLFDVLPTLPDGFANLIIVDPPYNLPRNFGDKKFTVVSPQQYEEYLRSWFSLLCDKLAPDGTLYMCGDWRCSSSMQRVIEERLTILNRITWQREKGRGAAHNWKNSMEDIWFAVKNPKDYYFDVEAVKVRRRVLAPYREEGRPKDWEETSEGRFRTTFPSNFWDDISVPFWSMPENTDHPTQKPEKLIAKLILASSREGDVVFDPFLGSGTTAVAAKKLGRRYCGIELHLDYCLLAAKRLLLADQDKTIQGYAEGVFWERHSGH